MYKTLTRKEADEFLQQTTKKEPYKMKGHSFTPLKGIGKSYCKNCGLVALNNPLTNWCIDKGCNYSDHSQYSSKRKRFTKLK